MRILHIINNLGMGGGQNLLVSLTGAQKENGNDVTVLQLVKSPNETVMSKIQERGVKVEWLTKDQSYYNPTVIPKIIPWLKKGRFDIVHVHLFPALYWVGFAKLLSFNSSPIVYTEHSTKNNRRTNFFLRNVDNFLYTHCYKRIIACADKALETYLKVYPNVKHACAVNNGVDIKVNINAKPYTKQELLGVTEDAFVVTMVASFLFMKRQDTIVEAINKLPEKFHAVFVGGKETDKGLQKVKELAQSLNVENRVHFLYLRSDVPRILKTSDVNIMSSEHEGLSLSSIEGMAAGKPFVATNVNGLREVVGGAGELFELYNSDDLAALLQKFDGDKKFYAEVSKKCSIRAAEYDVSNMEKGYMNVYHDVLEQIK